MKTYSKWPKIKSVSDEICQKGQNRDFYFTIFFDPGSAGVSKIKFSNYLVTISNCLRRPWTRSKTRSKSYYSLFAHARKKKSPKKTSRLRTRPVWGQFYTIWTKNTRAVMFFGNFEQPCTEHEIWTSRLRSFEAKNMKKGKICVDNTKLFVIKGNFWLYFFENTQLLHTYFFYVYTTHTQLHTCHILVFKYSTHVTHM
jgi:hypothetical protein